MIHKGSTVMGMSDLMLSLIGRKGFSHAQGFGKTIHGRCTDYPCTSLTSGVLLICHLLSVLNSTKINWGDHLQRLGRCRARRACRMVASSTATYLLQDAHLGLPERFDDLGTRGYKGPWTCFRCVRASPSSVRGLPCSLARRSSSRPHMVPVPRTM